MSLIAVGMVLGAAVVHAIWNALAKRSDDALAYFWLISAAALAIYALPFAFLATEEPFRWDWLRFAVASALLHVAYFVALARAYERADLSFVYPVARGTGLLLVPVLAVPLFGDRPTAIAWGGIALVAAGIGWFHLPVLRAVIARSGLRDLISMPALLTGLIIAVYPLNDAAGVARAHPIVYLYVVYLLDTLIMAPYLLLRRRAAVRRTMRSTWPVLVGGLGSFGTYLIVLAATRLAPVSYVVPMRETSIVVGALIGARVLGEPLGRTRLTGCALVTLGVIAIGAGG